MQTPYYSWTCNTCVHCMHMMPHTEGQTPTVPKGPNDCSTPSVKVYCSQTETLSGHRLETLSGHSPKTLSRHSPEELSGHSPETLSGHSPGRSPDILLRRCLDIRVTR